MIIEADLLNDYEEGSFLVKVRTNKKWFEFWKSGYKLIPGYYTKLDKNVSILIYGLEDILPKISELPFKPASEISVYSKADRISITYSTI